MWHASKKMTRYKLIFDVLMNEKIFVCTQKRINVFLW
jgi:hypothetical protein